MLGWQVTWFPMQYLGIVLHYFGSEQEALELPAGENWEEGWMEEEILTNSRVSHPPKLDAKRNRCSLDGGIKSP